MKIELVFAFWNETLGTLTRDHTYGHVSAVPRDLDTLPQWIQERIAVLRLLDKGERTPLGGWTTLEKTRRNGPTGEFIQIGLVRQPGDPEWEE